MQRQAAQVDADKLNAARQSVRTEYQDAAKEKLKDTFGERYSLMRMMDSRKRVEKLLKEYAALEVIAENRNIQRAIGHHDSEKEHQCYL